MCIVPRGTIYEIPLAMAVLSNRPKSRGGMPPACSADRSPRTTGPSRFPTGAAEPRLIVACGTRLGHPLTNVRPLVTYWVHALTNSARSDPHSGAFEIDFSDLPLCRLDW
jgi:hypothetical protein